jgi:hypothetical protein
MRKLVHRVLPVVGAAVLVAALVLGAGYLKALSLHHGPAASPVAAVPSGNASVLVVDDGTVAQADVTACLTAGFATDAARVDVLYGVRQLRLDGSNPVLVLRNAAGDVRLCDQFGPDSPSQSGLPTASPTEPVTFLSTGRSSWTCAGSSKVLDRFEQSNWLVVSPLVAKVQQRFWVDGVAGPWFETAAQDGYVHLQSWVKGPEPAGTTYAEQFRVLDADGIDVQQDALPTRPSALVGCSAGGTAQIG